MPAEVIADSSLFLLLSSSEAADVLLLLNKRVMGTPHNQAGSICRVGKKHCIFSSAIALIETNFEAK